jgi:selenophosphate synthetase-related protein
LALRAPDTLGLGGALLEGAGAAEAALPNQGDQAAVIPQGQGYLLLACDGLPSASLALEPEAAARASVTAAVSHIYAQGGRPLALVNLLVSGEEEQRARLAAGVRRACAELRVSLAGGRLDPQAAPGQPALAVAALGQARAVLRGHLARSGDDLIFAADLRGGPSLRSFSDWDSHVGKTSEQILARLEALPAIAEQGLALAARDVGRAGVVGAAAILAENAGLGALVELRDIPCPAEADPFAWLQAFLSYGFVLAAPPANSSRILGLFRERGLAAEVIGRFTAEPLVVLESGPLRQVLFDLEHEAITGGVPPLP